MTKAFTYLRCSGLSQVDGDTFPRQREKVQEYAEKNDIDIIKEFRDEGVSGTKDCFDRDGLNDLFIEIKSNGVRLILIENATRLARDLMVSEIILSEFRKLGVKVIPVDSGIDLCVEDGDATRVLIRHILTAVSQWEKTMFVQKMRAAKVRMRKANPNRKLDGKKPYGGHPDKPEEQETLAKIKALRNEGLSYADIADHLNAQNVKTRHGKKWYPTTIQNFLSKQ